MRKTFLKRASILSLSALMAMQCGTAVWADAVTDAVEIEAVIPESIVTDELGMPVPAAEASSEDNSYEQVLPCGSLRRGMAAASDAEVAAIKSNWNSFAASDSEITAEVKDASYNYTKDYYYNQLTSAEKAQYKEVVDDMDSILASSSDLETVSLKVNWDNGDGTTTTRTEPVFYIVEADDFDRTWAMMDALVYSNAQFFFIEQTIGVTLSDGSYGIALITYDGYEDGSTRMSAYKQINSIATSWLSQINACSDDLTKEGKIIELICNTSKYHLDTDGESIIGNDSNQTMAGCLLNRECVCAGFARTFNYFCHKVGINSVGMLSDSHAWNMVQINGKWYETCLTMINQRYTYGFNPDCMWYEGMNRGTNILQNDDLGGDMYVYTDYMAETFTYPKFAYDMPISFYTRAESKADGQATVYWRNTYGANRYAVYTYLNGKYTCVASVPAQSYSVKYCSTTIKNLTGGTKYGFLVRAEFDNYINDTTTWSGFTSACITYATVQGSNSPKITKIIDNAGVVGLNWSTISGATNYAVYTYLNGKYTCVGTSTKPYMYVRNLTPGTTYGFLVRAYINGSWSSFTSNDIMYYTLPESKPAITKAVNTSLGTVGLNWTSVSGATNYAVYTYLNGKYTCVGTTTKTGRYVTDLKQGTRYGFLVRAYVNGKWTSFGSSDIVYLTTASSLSGSVSLNELENITANGIVLA